MRTSPVNVVDPAEFAESDRDRIDHVAAEVSKTGQIDVADLPLAVREQLLFALEAYRRGESVAAVAGGKPLTTTEAARLLGMSRSHLTRLCDEGRIDSFPIGNALRIPADEVMRILTERGRAKTDARAAAATAEQRRRARAAQAAGLAMSNGRSPS